MIRRTLALAAALLLGPASAHAQVLWTFDEASAAVDGGSHKLYGWDSRWGSFGTEFSDARVVGGGPNGGDSVLFTYLTWPGQIYAGGSKTVTAPAFGSSIFVRGRLKYHVGNLADVHTQKLVIVANNLPGNRPILTVGTHLGPPNILTFDMQIDGGGGIVSSGGFPIDTWLSFQFEVSPGSVSGATDGYYKLWTATSGTMVYASPHGTRVNAFTDVERQEMGSIYMGFYMNDPKIVTDTWTIEYADWEIASTFDPNWPTTPSGGGGSGASRYRVRFRGPVTTQTTTTPPPTYPPKPKPKPKPKPHP